MGDARGKVTGGVHSISGGGTKRHADGDDDVSDRHETGRAAEERVDDKYREHKHERCDELTEEIVPGIPYGWCGAEDSQLHCRVFGSLEMVIIEKIDQHGAAETA